MPTQIAFLRALNVVGRRVKMDYLCQLFDELGLAEVDSYLASGNVIFSSEETGEALEGRIEAHLEGKLGYTVETFVRTMDELAAVAQSGVFAEEAQAARTKRYVAFMKSALSDEQEQTLVGLQNDVDQFQADGRELWWLRDIDAGRSMPTGAVTKELSIVATRRTFTTVERIVKKFAP